MRIRFLHTEGFRLSALFAGVFALSAMAMGATVLVITDETLREQVVQFSRADLAAIADGYREQGLHEAQEVIEQRMAAPGASDYFLLQQDGKRIGGNLPAMTPMLGVRELAAPGNAPDHAVLGVGTNLPAGLYAFAGSDLYRVNQTHVRILHLLLLLFAGALLIAVLGGALVSRGFLRRTDTIARACRAIMNGNLKARIPVRGTQDELDRLSDTINDMLERIESLMGNLAQVTNDIAHDLRTPVTHLRHRLERARQDCTTPEEYREALESAIVASDEILALFSALLRIAQIEGGARQAGFATVDLRDLLAHLKETFAPVAEDQGHTLGASLMPLSVRGDRQLLTQLFSNLIENAIVHTPPGTAIALNLFQRDGRVVAAVCDTGPGVPVSEHAKLFRRLYRHEASRTRPGYGLGLALANAIAELHGAQAWIVPVSPGLTVEVAFAPHGQQT